MLYCDNKLGKKNLKAKRSKKRELRVKTIKISTEKLHKESISPFIYGEFVEFLNDLIRGMWAEKIRDRCFEGISQPSNFYTKEHDFIKPYWELFTCGNKRYGERPLVKVQFDLDPHQPFAGSQSARIAIGGRSGLGGILQNGISLVVNEKLMVEAYIRGEHLTEDKVHILIGHNWDAYFETYGSIVFTGITDKWKKVSGTMTSAITDANASFVIGLSAPGTIWVDKTSLMPEINCGGWRSDVVKATKELKPGIIRFGGSSLIFYKWQMGIGPREKRVPFINKPWNNMEDNDVGLDEFLHFCELVDAEPLVCINCNNTTPEEIAHEVEYCNGSIDTKYGCTRAENGHPDPYSVKYWQIGNEQSGEQYERVMLDYAHSMKAVDPSIVLMASYPSRNIVDNLSSDFDFICPHYYGSNIEDYVRLTQKLRGIITASPTNPHLELGITEWNHTAGDWGIQRAWLQTLYNALYTSRLLNHFQRNCDIIVIANRSNLVNSCLGGVIQTSPSDMYLTPAYYAGKLYSNLSGTFVHRIEQQENDALDISATVDGADKYLTLIVINMADSCEERVIDLTAFDFISAKAHVWTLAGPSPSSINSFVHKDAVVPVESNIHCGKEFKHHFSSCSLTAIQIKIAR